MDVEDFFPHNGKPTLTKGIKGSKNSLLYDEFPDVLATLLLFVTAVSVVPLIAFNIPIRIPLGLIKFLVEISIILF